MYIRKPTRVVQLVRANTRKCDLSKWYMVMGLNSATDDTWIYLVLVVVGRSAPQGLGPHEES